MELRYTHLDVFTDELFGGNQLAVFLDPPAGLPAPTMQALANEMAFAESTFIFAAERPDTDVRVRIFTPSEELPMAGHPTIGTAFALARSGWLRAPRDQVVFGEGIGPVPVALTWSGETLSFAWMTQPEPVFGVELDPAGMADALGLSPDDLCPDGLPVQEASCGTPYVIVPVRTREAVDRSKASAAALVSLYARSGRPAQPVYLFTREPGGDAADVYTRMFAPMLGITEDAATGSAAGPLGGYLAARGLWRGGTLLNLQGRRMGRPSWLHIEPVMSGTRVAAVRVGGGAVIAGHGVLHLP